MGEWGRASIALARGVLYLYRPDGVQFVLYPQQGRMEKMKNPLDSIWGTIISGLVLTAVLAVVVAGLV